MSDTHTKTTEYVLIAAPGGSDLNRAVKRLVRALESGRYLSGPYEVHDEDVEDVLCLSHETNELLRDLPVDGRPKMGHVTGYLPRTQVVRLWSDALRQSLNNLRLRDLEADERQGEDGGGRVNLLSCHLDLYGGRWGELYSPVDIPSLVAMPGVKCSHVVLLIDDIYDMYRRLSGRKHLFDEDAMISTEEWELRHEIEEREKEGLRTAPKPIEVRTLEKLIERLSSLIAWRRAEMLTAEALARQLDAEYLVFGVKHRTVALARWLTGEATETAYVSHPITVPRKLRRKTGRWPRSGTGSMVDQCNWLPLALGERVTCVMPTAIDELRIASDENDRLIPQLEARWPSAPDGGFLDTLYCLDVPTRGGKSREASSDRDARHRLVLAPRGRRPSPEEGDASLRVLKSLIEAEVRFRDHHLVVNGGSLIVFRPYYSEGRATRGVMAEADHWSLLADAEGAEVVPTGRTNSQRRAVFIHFVEDVRTFLARIAETEDGEHMPIAGISVLGHLVDLLIKAGYARRGMAQRLVRTLIEDRSFESLLDAGLVPAHRVSELRKDWESLKRNARLHVLGQELSLGVMPDRRAAIWLIEDEAQLRRVTPGVGEFLCGQLDGAPREWEARAHELWTEQAGLIRLLP